MTSITDLDSGMESLLFKETSVSVELLGRDGVRARGVVAESVREECRLMVFTSLLKKGNSSS